MLGRAASHEGRSYGCFAFRPQGMGLVKGTAGVESTFTIQSKDGYGNDRLETQARDLYAVDVFQPTAAPEHGGRYCEGTAGVDGFGSTVAWYCGVVAKLKASNTWGSELLDRFATSERTVSSEHPLEFEGTFQNKWTDLVLATQPATP